MSSDQLSLFRNQNFLNLETYRKSGQAMLTPVWFVEDGGLLYVRTVADSGKVKRVRNNHSVRVAPCDRVGVLLGEWAAGQARLVDGTTAEHVNQLLKRKYGLQKSIFDLLGWFRKMKEATLAIELSSTGG